MLRSARPPAGRSRRTGPLQQPLAGSPLQGRAASPRTGGRAAARRVLPDDELLGTAPQQDTFYDLLGVDPGAPPSAIRKAYHGLIRSYHPDRAGPGAAGEASAELCALLNEVYATLSDPGRRAAYDQLAGFALASTNPFTDGQQDHSADQVFVDEFACIGCNKCVALCPHTFQLEELHGRARAVAQGVDSGAQVQQAMDVCPVSCIHWVTAPQLALLEVAMARMERVPVGSIRTTAVGASRSVFLEASLAFEKRHYDLQRRRREALAGQATGASSSVWAFMAGIVDVGGAFGARMHSRGSGEQQEGASTSEANSSASSSSFEEASPQDAKGVARLAARAARAARTWRSFRELERAKRRALLPVAGREQP